jgi:CIC family chloride channel protein
MRNAQEVLAAQMGIREAVERVRSSDSRAWLVEDGGSLVGVVSWAKLELALNTDGAIGKKLADLLDRLDFPHVHADQALHLALERMSAERLDRLPVVSRANIHQLEGIVTLRDVLDSYGVDQ